MILHKYDVGDKVRFYFKKMTDEGTLEAHEDADPICGIIKRIFTDYKVIYHLYPSLRDKEKSETLYVVEVDIGCTAFKKSGADPNLPAPDFIIKESDLEYDYN